MDWNDDETEGLNCLFESSVPISSPEAALLLVSIPFGVSFPLALNVRGLWGQDC